MARNISMTLKRNPYTNTLSSGYELINPLYQLSAGRFSPTRKPLTLLHPRPDSETYPDEFHRMAQVGQPVSIKIKACWGAYPYSTRIVSAPVGSTIGEWMTPDATEDLQPDFNYCTLTIPPQTAGNYQIIVGICDQEGAYITARWTLNFGNNYYYGAPIATGLGDGSSRANAASWATIYGANADAISPARGKIVELSNGNYPFSMDIALNSNKPRVIIGVDGGQYNFVATLPEIRVRPKNNGIHLRNIKISDVTGGPAIETVEYYDRQSIDQYEFNNCSGDPGGAYNEAGWFIWSTNNATRRKYFWMDQGVYTNCHEIAGFDWYSVAPCLVERLTWNTNRTTIEEPICYFKASCEGEIRHVRFDLPLLSFDPSVTGVIQIGNNEQYSDASVHVRFNFIRTKHDADLNAVTYNAAPTASSTDNWDDHNTYLGGKVTAKNINGDDMVNFSNTVVVNVLGGIGMPEGGGATITNCLTGTSGIVDANGKIVGPNRGIIGYQIYAG